MQAVCKEAGTGIVIDLGFPKEKIELLWTKNKVKIFHMKAGQIRIEISSITEDGSLELKNLKAADDGTYEGEAFDIQGRSHKSKAITICVIGEYTRALHYITLCDR